MTIKKKVLIISVSILIILSATGLYYYFNKIKPYNDAMNNASKAIVSEDYDNAIAVYTEALSYKNNSDANKKIELAKLLKKSKSIYSTAIKQTADKKYLEAIDNFKKVDKQDSKRYSTAQSKVSKCKKLYIADNLKSANDNLANNKFNEANKYLDNIFKIDSNNTDAKKVKDNVAKVIQKQKDDAAAAAIQAKATQNKNKSITKQQAIQIVKQIYKNVQLYEFDHMEKQNGLDFYCIHVYEFVNDIEGGHTATIAWCMVQKNNGKAYDMILDTNLTTPLN